MIAQPWFPFAVLCAACVAAPPYPAWLRRLDWLVVGAWIACLAFCLVVWMAVFVLVWWAA